VQSSRAGALAVLRRDEEARQFMFARLSGTIRHLEGKAEDLAFLDVASRLAKYLVECSRMDLPIPLTQDDLAAAIGSTRMTVNKLLADSKDRGIIEVARRPIGVIDEPMLLRDTQ